MCLKDISMLEFILIIIAIICAPLIAVKIANKLEDRREKRNDKITLLKDLMAHRKNDDASRITLSKALNLIDVVFHGHEEILKAYHTYRNAFLKQKDQEVLRCLFVKFVSFVIRDLGYSIADKDIHLCIGAENLSSHLFWEKVQDNTQGTST